jgi:class 3 adenylate cyclase/pimeloyl-ACP methyl ester carboxylesterase
MGNGPTVVHMPEQPFSHQLLWPKVFPEQYDGMNARFRTIRYDVRGSGLSERGVTDFSLEAMLRDLEAVVAELDEPFALVAQFDSVPVAVTFAVRQSERVSQLVLIDGYTCFNDYEKGQALGIERAVREKDWALSTEIISGVLAGLDGEAALAHAEYLRACIDQNAYAASQEAIEAYDVRELLDKVAAATLVLHTKTNRWLPEEVSRKLAAGIRHSQLAVIDDAQLRSLPEILGDFILAASPLDPDASAGTEPSLRIILFTDIVGHTEMMRRLGDELGRQVLRDHERITRETLRRHSGIEVKTMGDGFMASFASVTRAMECAVALQRAFAASDTGGGGPLSVRVGLNAGEPIEEDGDLFGSTVILAARIAAKAAGGEILIPEPVRHLLSGKAFVYADRGEYLMKGFEDAVRLFQVSWEE